MPVQVNTAALDIVVKEAKTLLALKKLYELDTKEKLLTFETSIIMLENSLKSCANCGQQIDDGQRNCCVFCNENGW